MGGGYSRFDQREQAVNNITTRAPRALIVGGHTQCRRIAPHHEKLSRKAALEAAAETLRLLQIPNAEQWLCDCSH